MTCAGDDGAPAGGGGLSWEIVEHVLDTLAIILFIESDKLIVFQAITKNFDLEQMDLKLEQFNVAARSMYEIGEKSFVVDR
ncbi:hypothetical protein EVAR_35946_1 [Eumeta japonica]|uniref:Uncharacterized protein n=1 Tax=Eumeta variegata TaxID=151549 RepID=A0A4C1W303_EUMVA|nr:hypothetical protein EVAR_35946_1 [Eumeta japonica]